MTKEEFSSQFRTIGDLLDYCYENNLSTCEDILDKGTVNDLIDEYIPEYLRRYSWEDLFDELSYINRYGDYYIANGGLEFTSISNEDEYEVSHWAGLVYNDAVANGLISDDIAKVDEWLDDNSQEWESEIQIIEMLA